MPRSDMRLTILHNSDPIVDVTPGGAPAYAPGFEMVPAARSDAVQGMPGRMLQVQHDGVDIGNDRPAVINIVADEGIMSVTRGAGENSHVVTLRVLAAPGCTHYFTDTFTGAALANELLLHTPDLAPAGFAYPETGDITGFGLDGLGSAIPGGRSGNAVSISRSSSTFGGAWAPIALSSNTFSTEIVATLTDGEVVGGGAFVWRYTYLNVNQLAPLPYAYVISGLEKRSASTTDRWAVAYVRPEGGPQVTLEYNIGAEAVPEVAHAVRMDFGPGVVALFVDGVQRSTAALTGPALSVINQFGFEMRQVVFGALSGISSIDINECNPAPVLLPSTGWLLEIDEPDVGVAAHANTGTMGSPPADRNVYAGIVGYTTGTVVWSITSWVPLFGSPSPTINQDHARADVVRVQIGGGESAARDGILTITATVGGIPAGDSIILTIGSDPFYPNIAWGPEP